MNTKEEKCRSCKGVGRRAFHGPFASVMANCNFCKGTGERKDELKWYENMRNKLNN